mmetsp:Transcript_1244/g.2618  ORF Transcript_1244/g.2618 Transcript_1244/m.2618 type:complete len:100 (-) Transcript_1244:648-947(-)
MTHIFIISCELCLPRGVSEFLGNQSPMGNCNWLSVKEIVHGDDIIGCTIAEADLGVAEDDPYALDTPRIGFFQNHPEESEAVVFGLGVVHPDFAIILVE